MFSSVTDWQRRYARHLVLPNIGEEGQRRLSNARVLVVGAGGLGANCLMALAASGVGKLTIVDPDHVELSNLPRQMLYETADIGRPKVLAAKDRLEEMNPDIHVNTHLMRLDEGNAAALLAGQDLVIDGTDQFASRYVMNDACMQARIPWVHAAMLGWTAHLTSFAPHHHPDLPCYRCYVPELPEREYACAQAGLVGPLAGMIGQMQALEALRILLGVEQPLFGRMLRIDAKTMQVRSSVLTRDPACEHRTAHSGG